MSNLEREDHKRDAAFNKAMHGKSAQASGGFSAMFAKGGDAKKAAVDEYFKHWDNKDAKEETEETRAVSRPVTAPPPPEMRGYHDKRLMDNSRPELLSMPP